MSPQAGTGRWWLEHRDRAIAVAAELRRAGYLVEGPELTNDQHGWRVSWAPDTSGNPSRLGGLTPEPGTFRLLDMNTTAAATETEGTKAMNHAVADHLAARQAAEQRLADPAFAAKVLGERRITTEICAYCHAIEGGDADPIRCRYGVRSNGIKSHRFDTIEMDARLAEMATKIGLDAIRPNFFWGFDVPGEGIRFSTEYASGDENIDLYVFDGPDPEHAVVTYRISFGADTPASVIFAAGAEAMATRRNA